MDYKNKYFKYKNKYLNLMYGGGILDKKLPVRVLFKIIDFGNIDALKSMILNSSLLNSIITYKYSSKNIIYIYDIILETHPNSKLIIFFNKLQGLFESLIKDICVEFELSQSIDEITQGFKNYCLEMYIKEFIKSIGFKDDISDYFDFFDELMGRFKHKDRGYKRFYITFCILNPDPILYQLLSSTNINFDEDDLVFLLENNIGEEDIKEIVRVKALGKIDSSLMVFLLKIKKESQRQPRKGRKSRRMRPTDFNKLNIENIKFIMMFYNEYKKFYTDNILFQFISNIINLSKKYIHIFNLFKKLSRNQQDCIVNLFQSDHDISDDIDTLEDFFKVIKIYDEELGCYDMDKLIEILSLLLLKLDDIEKYKKPGTKVSKFDPEFDFLKLVFIKLLFLINLNLFQYEKILEIIKLHVSLEKIYIYLNNLIKLKNEDIIICILDGLTINIDNFGIINVILNNYGSAGKDLKDFIIKYFPKLLNYNYNTKEEYDTWGHSQFTYDKEYCLNEFLKNVSRYLHNILYHCMIEEKLDILLKVKPSNVSQLITEYEAGEEKRRTYEKRKEEEREYAKSLLQHHQESYPRLFSGTEQPAPKQPAPKQPAPKLPAPKLPAPKLPAPKLSTSKQQASAQQAPAQQPNIDDLLMKYGSLENYNEELIRKLIMNKKIFFYQVTEDIKVLLQLYKIPQGKIIIDKLIEKNILTLSLINTYNEFLRNLFINYESNKQTIDEIIGNATGFTNFIERIEKIKSTFRPFKDKP